MAVVFSSSTLIFLPSDNASVGQTEPFAGLLFLDMHVHDSVD